MSFGPGDTGMGPTGASAVPFGSMPGLGGGQIGELAGGQPAGEQDLLTSPAVPSGGGGPRRRRQRAWHAWPASRRAILRRQVFTGGLLLAVLLAMLLVPTTTANSGTGGSTIPAYVTRPAAPGTPGVTVGGYRCGPGVRQFPWSAYAPICIPKWHGNNGGATSPGVTATTIRLSYRVASTTDLKLLYGLLPPTVIGTNAEAIRTMQAYINIFNKVFELYGRKVVLVPFTGQGNFISEDTGTGQAQAHADAVTARTKLQAFADMSLVDSSVIYVQSLEDEHVIAFGLYLQDYNWYAENAPWQYTPGPNCTKEAEAAGAVIGREMAGHRAIYAGSAATRAKVRKFGLIYPNNPQAAICANLIQQQMARYGASVAVKVAFTFNLSNLVNQAQSAIAQMQAAGVTTVISSGTDPVSPTFFLQAADQQDYHPEWFTESYFAGGTSSLDPFVQIFQKHAPDQVGSIITTGNPSLPPSKQEALLAYKLGHDGNLNGILPSYPFTYGSILMFFDALQAAGPYLTPKTFEQGLANVADLPPSKPGGMLGGWSFGPGTFDPASNFEVMRWDPTKPSPQNGQPGTFVACDQGKVFGFAKVAKEMPATRLECPR